jgi:hypothetical protein
MVGAAVTLYTSNRKNSKFEYRCNNRLSRQKFFVIFLGTFRKNKGKSNANRSLPLLSKMFQLISHESNYTMSFIPSHRAVKIRRHRPPPTTTLPPTPLQHKQRYVSHPRARKRRPLGRLHSHLPQAVTLPP